MTVTRQAMSLTGTGGTSTTGGPTQITVRGFGPQFNETLFDGRQVPTAIGNVTRGFDFGSMGSDFVSQVDVLKTPDATLSSGAIGATINIKYPKPFDHPGMQLAGSLSGTDTTGENKVTPNGSLLFSDTFADDRFGILVDGGYADSQGARQSRQHSRLGRRQPGRGRWFGALPIERRRPAPLPPPRLGRPQLGGHPSINDWFIQDYGIYQEHNDDKRVGGRFVLQAKPVDGLEMTLDDNYAKETLVQNTAGFQRLVQQQRFDGCGSGARRHRNQFHAAGYAHRFSGTDQPVGDHDQHPGVQREVGCDGHTSYMFDAYNAVAKLNPGNQAGIDADVGYGNGPNATSLGIVVPGGNNLPYPTGFGPAGVAANFVNPAFIGSHVLVESYNQNTDTINQLKLEGGWHDDQLKFKYGVQFTRDAETLRAFTDLPYTWQMYAGYGPPPVGSGGVAPIPANLDIRHFQHRLGLHQRLGQRRPSAAEYHCGQRLRDPELPAGFEWRGAERQQRAATWPAPRPAPASTSCTRISAARRT